AQCLGCCFVIWRPSEGNRNGKVPGSGRSKGRVTEFSMSKGARAQRYGITAWLVTWEHDGDHAVPPSRIAAILSSRWSPERVRDEVELIYVNSHLSLAE